MAFSKSHLWPILTKMGSLLSAPLTAAPQTLPLSPTIASDYTLQHLIPAFFQIGLFEVVDDRGFL